MRSVVVFCILILSSFAILAQSATDLDKLFAPEKRNNSNIIESKKTNARESELADKTNNEVSIGRSGLDAVGASIGNAMKGGGAQSGANNAGLGNVCASINDMSLKTYCNTGECNALGFNYPEHQALCSYRNSNSLYKTKVHAAIQNYINHGMCDTFQLREKAGLAQTTVNSFCRVKDNPSLRTMMVIMWLNGITFRY